MKKKKIAGALLASCIALSATFAGCSLVTSDSKKDMDQVIASVDISKAENFDAELSDYKAAVGATEIIKFDLVSYFINVGASYINQGMSYRNVFDMLMNALVDNAVQTQYAVMSLLKTKAEEEGKTASQIVAEYSAKDTDVAKYEYLLGEDSDEVRGAKYAVMSTLNASIDAREQTTEDDDDEYSGSDSRSAPANVDTEREDYFPVAPAGDEVFAEGELYYNVYTGYDGYLLNESGAYKDDAIEGTNRARRKQAYNSFITTLYRNNLFDDSENRADVWNISYTQNMYARQLESEAVDKYYENYEDEMAEWLKADDYQQLQGSFDQLFTYQSETLTEDNFTTSMDSMSSSSFLLYSPNTEADDDGTTYSFGFVYNILLPFSASQSAKLAELQSVRDLYDDQDGYYYARNQLLKNVYTEDQRAAWFNGTTDYSFNVSESEKYTGTYYNPGNDRNYLFFENNLSDSQKDGKYEKLDTYDGRYAYNGYVAETEEGSYILIPKKLDIDDMLAEFKGYVDFVLGDDGEVTFDNAYEPATGNAAFYNTTDFMKTDGDKDDELDCSKLIYATGKVTLSGESFDRAGVKAETKAQYLALSAVNELQYAYTTDTAILSRYLGYSVSAYDTSYIAEFEYAAKTAINNGAGSFSVCAGDYGWHLIYVTYAFDKAAADGKQYTPDWSVIEGEEPDEGSFEYQFYEWRKSQDLSDVSSTRRSKVLSVYSTDKTVTKYEKRYKDLLNMGNN